MWRSRASLAAAATLAFVACPNAAVRSKPVAAVVPQVRDIRATVLDIRESVRDTGGAMRALRIDETPERVRVAVPADVLFAFDRSDLQPHAQRAIAAIAQLIRRRARGRVRVEGYTDAKGSGAYNLGLSQRRAAAVVRALVARGIDAASLVAVGFGARNPVAPNMKPDGSDEPAGRAKNRRVIVVIPK